ELSGSCITLHPVLGSKGSPPRRRDVQRVLVLTGDAAEELDVMYPVYRLREAGYAVDVAALSRRDVQLVIHDFDPESDAYTEKNGRKLPVDLAFSEVDPSEYVALV